MCNVTFILQHALDFRRKEVKGCKKILNLTPLAFMTHLFTVTQQTFLTKSCFQKSERSLGPLRPSTHPPFVMSAEGVIANSKRLHIYIFNNIYTNLNKSYVIEVENNFRNKYYELRYKIELQATKVNIIIRCVWKLSKPRNKHTYRLGMANLRLGLIFLKKKPIFTYRR